MPVWARWSLLLAFVVTNSGCSGGTDNAPSSIDLTGTWSGVVGAGSGGGRALRVTWSATQSGSSVSGPATLLTSPPVTNVTFVGILSGTLTGTQLSFSYVSSPGSVRESDMCSLSGNGNAAIGSNTMSGRLDVMFVSCTGLDLEPPLSDQLAMTKQ
jgi:hypothetical protein